MEEFHVAPRAPLVSCIVATHNSRDELIECLKTLIQTAETIPIEILVIDNVSSDGTGGIVRQRFPSVEYVYNSENVFLAGANNQGLARARGKYALIINPDVFVEKETLRKMIEFMEAHPSAGAASCRFLNRDSSEIQTCWSFRTLRWVIMSREPLRRLFVNSKTIRNARMEGWDRHTQREVDVVSGAFIFARRSALQEVGFFDENFLIFFTDDDICMRLSRAGFSILHNPDTAICHLVSQSTLRNSLPSILKIQRGDLVRYFRKYHGVGAGLVAWVAATLELFVWWFYLLFKGGSRVQRGANARR